MSTNCKCECKVVVLVFSNIRYKTDRSSKWRSTCDLGQVVLSMRRVFRSWKFSGTDVGRTRDLRFTRATPYHLATAPYFFSKYCSETKWKRIVTVFSKQHDNYCILIDINDIISNINFTGNMTTLPLYFVSQDTWRSGQVVRRRSRKAKIACSTHVCAWKFSNKINSCKVAYKLSRTHKLSWTHTEGFSHLLQYKLAPIYMVSL